MIVSVETQIRQHLLASDATQDPIDFEEIVSRLEDDHGFERNHGLGTPSARGMSPVATRGLLVAAAAATITLFVLGLIPLLSGGQEVPPADTMPPPETPTTATTHDTTTEAAQDTTGDSEPQAEDDATAPLVFRAIPSNPVSVDGPLTWRTVELPADGRIRVGLDDRFYLIAEDAIWISDNGLEWTGHQAGLLLGDWFAVGQDRLITAWGGGFYGDAEGPTAPRPLKVAIYDLPEVATGELALVAITELAVDGIGAESVAIGPQGAIVATPRSLFYSNHGDRWTPIEALQTGNAWVAATHDGFYLVDGATVFTSRDGVQWAEIAKLSSSGRLRRWGNGALTHDEFTIWRITPAGAERLHESSAPFNIIGPADVAGSELGVLAVGLDLDGLARVFDGDGRGYAYSSDGVEWEQGTLPDGWKVINVFVEEPIAMNDQTILVVASGPESEGGGVLGDDLVLMATR